MPSVNGRSRTTSFKDLLERILIVTEGKETEPNYFNALIDTHKLKTVDYLDVKGTGFNTRSLVEEAQRLQNNASPPYDEVWCVFDRDDFPSDDFDNAVAKIQAISYLHPAWSNESFELWYVLHFRDYDLGSGRKGYIDKLRKLVVDVGLRKYEKNNRQMYEKLGTQRLEVACSNARKLLALYDEATPCHKRKPATLVVDLVERLLSLTAENRFKSEKQ